MMVLCLAHNWKVWRQVRNSNSVMMVLCLAHTWKVWRQVRNSKSVMIKYLMFVMMVLYLGHTLGNTGGR